MGNNNSKDAGGESASQSQPSSPIATTKNPLVRQKSKRAESIHAQLVPKSLAATPTTSLETATGQSATATPTSLPQSRGRSEASSATAVPIPIRDASKRTTSASKPANTTATPHRSTSPGQRQIHGLTPITTQTPNQKPAISSAVEGLASPDAYYLPQPQFRHPPRVPLPIEEEVHDPGSPIPTPADLEGEDVPPSFEGGPLEETKSINSMGLDDDVGSTGEPEDVFAATGMTGMPKVPMLFEWKEGGSKIYVTGSFASWDKKWKLNRHGPSSDPHARSAMLSVPPGTHHVMFLVDGVLVASSHMPTTVEYGNVLVNYIEVPVLDRAHARGARTSQPAIPPTPELRPTGAITSSGGPTRTPSQKHRPASRSSPRPGAATTKKAALTTKFTSEIPEYLVRLDAAEGTSRYARASAVMETQPVPPSLPMFLSRSVLNGATPMKDDASVLVLPNHTVLNHLATSSIKAGVLATSATTRYKKKYVTTILYKPTSVDE